MAKLRLADAETIMDTALAEGRKLKLAPLMVVVLDAGGHVIACKREDRAGIVRFDIAYGKAWGALGMGFGTREITARAEKFPAFITSLYAISHGRAVPSPGDVLLLDRDNDVIGAAGVSGDTGDNDELCALAGIAAAGFRAAPGKVE
ncbi:MAG: GlcG/HbpS family heme-binding protein [Blastocatellia bacterium]